MLRDVALWHCPECSRQFDVPDGTVSFFHRCVREKREPALARIEELPPDDEGREAIWHGLLNMVRAVRPYVDVDD